MAGIPTVQQHVDTTILEAVLMHAVESNSNDSFAELLKTPAAQKLSSAVEGLLLAAVEHRAVLGLQMLLQLPAGQVLSSKTIATLLLVALLEPL
jgi:hypothetical protein